MKSRVKAKLRSCAGESIAETLVSTLIAALALLMLAGAISASTRLIVDSKDKMTKYYAANEEVEMQKTAKGNFRVVLAGEKVTLEDAAGGNTIVVNYYENKVIGNLPVISYALDTTADVLDESVETGG